VEDKSSRGLEDFIKEFSASLPWDKRLYVQDIRGSQAHCRMLARKGIIGKQEERLICEALEEILREIQEGVFPFSVELEDIHMNVERRLIEKVGEVGGKLHTARSRNDQIALDERLFLKEAVAEILLQLGRLMGAVLDQAQRHFGIIMPGYTHLQRAQPILFSHHMLAYYEMFRRDWGRMEHVKEALDEMPLGAGALAGVEFPIDPKQVAGELGFERIFRNSMDAVSDRDFLMEFLGASSILMIHCSRLCEELVLWSSQEFGYVSLADPFCSGSSIMPQKRNPDVAELIRGKTGLVVGNLVSIMVTMKALPLSYNKDMQEDKRPMLETVDAVRGSLMALSEMVRTMEVDGQRMERATREGYMTATDLADYLARKGVPFRSAHSITKQIVSHCIKRGVVLEDLPLEELQKFHESIEEDVYEVLRVKAAVEARSSPGGTASVRVEEALRRAQAELKERMDSLEGINR
jgi:argininosuccinate lyase